MWTQERTSGVPPSLLLSGSFIQIPAIYMYFPGLLAVFEHCEYNCHIDLGRIAYEASEEAGPKFVLLVVYKADCSVSLTSERSMSMLNNERLAAGPSRAGDHGVKSEHNIS